MSRTLINTCKLCYKNRFSSVSWKGAVIASRTIQARRQYAIYEPPEINVKPEIEPYENLWIRMKAHDFALIESYESHAKKLLNIMDVEIEEAFPYPTQESEQSVYDIISDGTDFNVAYTNRVRSYERFISITNLPSTKAAIVFEALHQNIPEGVDLIVQKPDDEVSEFRYVPNKVKEAMKLELENITELIHSAQ